MAFVTVEDVYGSIDCILFPKVYERFKDKLEPDAVIEVAGKLSLREGEKPAINVDKLKNFEEGESLGAAPSASAGERPPVMAFGGEKKEIETLYIKVEDESLTDEILDTLESYSGTTKVVLVIDGKKFNVREKVRLCKGLYFELYGLVDEKNVKIVKKSL